MRVTTTIMLKDLRQRLKDGSLLLFGLVLPLGMAFFFSQLLGGDSSDRLDIGYAVVNEDRGATGAIFGEEVLSSLEEEGLISWEEASDADEATRLVDDREIDAAFLIPEDFTERVEGGNGPSIEVIGSADAAVQVQVAREIAESFVVETGVAGIAVGTVLDSGSQDSPQAVVERLQAQDVPLGLTEETTSQWRELDTGTYYVAGLAYFFLFFVVMSSVTGILDERRDGTLGRLLAAPIHRSSILLGKSLSALVVGAAGLFVLVAISTPLLGASWGPLPGVIALVMAGTLAAVGITALVATFSSSSEQATNRISVLALGLGLLGGGLFPVSQLGWFSVLSFATPHRWFLHGLAELASGSFSAVLLPVLVLTAMAAVTGTLSLLRLGRMLNA